MKDYKSILINAAEQGLITWEQLARELIAETGNHELEFATDTVFGLLEDIDD